MRRFSLLVKTLIGFFIAFDLLYWLNTELASSPMNTFNAVGFFQRLPVWLVYLAWLFWPLVTGRVGAAPTPLTKEQVGPESAPTPRRAATDHLWSEATDEERASWIQGDDEPRE